MKFLFGFLLLILSITIFCQGSYRQCVQEYNELALSIESKKVQCEAIKENMAIEYEQRLAALREHHQDELNQLREKHMEENEELRRTYEQED